MLLAAGLSSRTTAEMVPCTARPSALEAHRALTTMDRERARLSAAIAIGQDALDDLIDADRTFIAGHADRPSQVPPERGAALHPVH